MLLMLSRCTLLITWKRARQKRKRNMPEESARRAHGDAQDLADLKFSKLDAVRIPGE